MKFLINNRQVSKLSNKDKTVLLGFGETKLCESFCNSI